MDKRVVALLTVMVEEAVDKIVLPEGQRGPRGLKGRDGNDFKLEDHADTIRSFVLESIPEKFNLTEEQKEELRGKDGKDFVLEDHIEELRNLIIANIPKHFELSEEQIQLLKGTPGKDGRDGRDFDLEDHAEEIEAFVKKHVPTEITLTDEQKEELRGPAGLDGKDGKDGVDGRKGRDGRDFIFDEHREEIEKIIKDVSLKFEDLSEEQVESLRGPKGQDGRDGKDGKDFVFSDNQDAINDLLVAYFNQIRDTLRLKFEDLSEEQVESLRGPRGRRGQKGKDFSLEEAAPVIEKQVKEHLDTLSPSLKLKFDDLTDKDKDSLKLKFEHLTDDDRQSLRGPRGQRGKMGLQGEPGKDGQNGKDGNVGPRGPIGPRGQIGPSGRDGRDGIDGADGKDAPKITDVKVEQYKSEFNLTFEFDDGSEIKTKDIELPKGDTTFYYPTGIGGGGSGSGGSGKSAYDIAVENGFVGTEQDWLDSLQGADGANGIDGTNGIDGANGTDGESAYEIAVANGFVGTEEEWLESLEAANAIEVQDEGTVISQAVTSINFIGDSVRVVPQVPISDWETLSDVEPSLDQYRGPNDLDPTGINVHINSDPTIISGVDCDASVFVGAFVRTSIIGMAFNAIADSMANSNVVGVVLSKQSSTSCTIKLPGGKVDGVLSGLDPALDYFLSATNPGEVTNVSPSGSGQVKLKLGYAFSSNSFILSPGERSVIP